MNQFAVLDPSKKNSELWDIFEPNPNKEQVVNISRRRRSENLRLVVGIDFSAKNRFLITKKREGTTVILVKGSKIEKN